MMVYDKLDWHLEGATKAGQPREKAFAHIGLYLGWIIRHELHDPGAMHGPAIDAVKGTAMAGSELIDHVDEKLTAAVLNAEGRAFSDRHYRTYLADYATLFEDVPSYTVADDPTTQARVATLLDGLYSGWVAARWPGLEREAGPGGAESEDLAADDLPDPELMSRFSVALEDSLPRAITDPPLRVNSVRASTWGAPALLAALGTLGVAPTNATVVIAMGGRGARTLTVQLYAVPGIAAGRLVDALEPAIALPPGGHWGRRTVTGRAVKWASGVKFAAAFWARDGLVTHVAGQARAVEEAIPQLR